MVALRPRCFQTLFCATCLSNLIVSFCAAVVRRKLDHQLDGTLLLQTSGKLAVGVNNVRAEQDDWIRHEDFGVFFGDIQSATDAVTAWELEDMSVSDDVPKTFSLESSSKPEHRVTAKSQLCQGSGCDAPPLHAASQHVTASSDILNLVHKSGKCVRPDDGSENPKDGAGLVFGQKCGKGEKSSLLRAIPAGGGYYVLQHHSGKCVHPRGGNAFPRNDTKLVYNNGCGTTNDALLVKPIPAAGDHYVLQHKSGMCVHPSRGAVSPADNVKLVYHHGCSTTNDALLFRGLGFSSPE